MAAACCKLSRSWSCVQKYQCFSVLVIKNNSELTIQKCYSQQAELDVQKVQVKRKKTNHPTGLQVQVVNHLKSSEKLIEIAKEIPEKYIAINKFPPEALYLVDPEVASTIVNKIKHLLPSSESSVPVMEANPGLGLVSEELLKAGVKHLRLHEPNNVFHHRLQALMHKYPDRQMDLKSEDVVNIFKLSFFDKIDNGNRIEELMAGIQPRSWIDPEPLVKVIATTPTKKSLRELIFSITFQNGIAGVGRPEYFLVMHPYNYIQLACRKEDGYNIYRYNSTLFQIMYSYTLLDKLPRQAFLPWESKDNYKETARLKQVRSIDHDYMYLVHAEAKPELLQQLQPHQLQQMWYFLKVNCMSRKNKIIPSLERWIPNCGPRLIRQGITIFTEFGDLNSDELLRLFQMFVSWPEFPDCPFQASMETAFLKNDPELEKDVEENVEVSQESQKPPPSL